VHRKLAAALLCATTLVAACGDDTDTAETGSGPTTAPAETTAPETRDPATDAGDAPERIVSLSATATEVLFAIGAEDQVVAVDEQSDYPPGVPTTDLSGYEPNVEAIAAYEPDLVVISGSPEDLAPSLEALGIEVYDQLAPATVDEALEQIVDLGIVTGHEDEAADLVADMQADIDELVAAIPERDEPLTYYHELDETLYSVTSSTFIGQVYALAGLENIADAADPDGALGGYPQLSAELIVDADPDFVFLADAECCGQNADMLAARPGFAGLTAVEEGRVIELDEDVASRWGPRIVDLLRTIVEATAA
jgi:iron complex transport system substrate-binding protein